MPRAKRPPTTKNGRPKKHIDWEWVDKMLICGGQGTEIAAALDIHPKTFYDRCLMEKGVSFTEYSTVKEEHGKLLIRSKQFESLMKGNITMQIWLGKQKLKQKEHHDQVASPNDDKLNQLLSDVNAMKEKLQNERTNSAPISGGSDAASANDNAHEPSNPIREGSGGELPVVGEDSVPKPGLDISF